MELNAGTVDSDAGAQLHANWTWAPSALDQAKVSRLSRLWFEPCAASARTCARRRGLTRRTLHPPG
ncbi:linear gramicidin synthetase subunit D domain protein [Mycobacterium xenopi 4042]|uniref:Linear gramicidin synthetase subunit D domain protein n=1 Tax=Mycobacterium xenopi 4042 TaxID=1299334 RepID=X8CN50_MYCXE|nr:linear gramicidin synthetase subunit D domain protein [Mycobacterium xenopi 4042]